VSGAQFQGRIERIEELLAAIEKHGNAVVRASAVELVRALLDVHQAGLTQILSRIAGQGEPGQAILNGLSQDDLVSRLLLLHGLHPVDLETRVRKALDDVRPRLQALDAEARLQHVAHDMIRVQLASGRAEVHRILEQALLAAAPDALRLIFEDADAPGCGRRPLPLVRES
jgi:hypothetical protein